MKKTVKRALLESDLKGWYKYVERDVCIRSVYIDKRDSEINKQKIYRADYESVLGGYVDSKTYTEEELPEEEREFLEEITKKLQEFSNIKYKNKNGKIAYGYAKITDDEEIECFKKITDENGFKIKKSDIIKVLN
jgi:hypothetical protein